MSKLSVIPQALSYQTDDGITLHAESWGNPANPPVLLSHGGGQTRHAWKNTGERLALEGWYAVAYDHRGHGESEWSPGGDYELPLFARDQVKIARTFATPPVLVGASLGGLSSLCALDLDDVAGQSPYAAIVLVDITPQMNQQGALKIMAFMEENMKRGFADLDEAATAIANYTGREKRVNHDGLKKNLRMTEDGRYRWHWDPAFMAMRHDASSSTATLIGAAQRATVPILLVRGMLSEIVTQQVADEFLSLVPKAQYVDVEDAAHMVAGDKNDVFSDSIIAFLKKL